ncbi:hypothetical protein KUC3_25230 [Alteromonas sp. KC3]|uniref:hypothetical protein n=1 Tax=unclassified Alteromonas TaxID=2614992 RepID=UPI001920C853|nr:MULTISPECIES: hypothetical protein [unclassified Alteromonas]BCO19666.1 hypothetical protein KUC3_25230 [Alteromonas sp. KC3]BCO23631.1 hypothetical protein KUC14_25000 [Alteromonas sp. KC14]
MLNKKQTTVVYWCCITLLMLALSLSSKASATLINSNFDNALDGWQGQVDIFDGANELFFVDINNFSDFSNNFSSNAGTLSLSTDFQGADEIFGVYLFQSFTVSASTHSLSLAFSAAADFFQVALFDSSSNLLHDFNTDGATADLSVLRGQQVSLEFAVGDTNFSLGDTLTVSNIQLADSSVAVSEPVSFSLLLIAFAGLWVRRNFVTSTWVEIKKELRVKHFANLYQGKYHV